METTEEKKYIRLEETASTPLVNKINIILLSLSIYTMVGILLYLVIKIHEISVFISNADTKQMEQCLQNLSLFCSNI